MTTNLELIKTFRKLQGSKCRTFAEYKCFCGNVAITRLDGFLSGHVKSCGCDKYHSRMKDYSDILNTWQNNLLIKNIFAKNHRTYADCQCICGKDSTQRLNEILTGRLKSCGCLKYEEPYRKELSTRALKDKPWEYNIKHGYAKDSTYDIYYGMLHRCLNSSNKSYHNYGGRGITICNRWLEASPQGFLNFLEDMGERPSKELSIDRIDNDGNYEPSNCRWASRKEQANNRRTNISFRGETKSFTEWCLIFNINPATAYQRIKAGWTFEQALTLKKWTKIKK